mgnify:FL=1
MLLGVALTTGFVSCSDDDPDYSNVTPPTVEIAPNTISGVISSINGNPISGATVSLDNTTVTTDANGVYLFSEVAAGSHSISAAANGKISRNGTVVVESSSQTQNVIWNTSLPEDRSTEINVTVNEGGEGTVSAESLENNEKAQVQITASVPEDVVSSDTKIEITPIYAENEANVVRTKAISRADGGTLLVGASISCGANVTLSKAINLGFEIDESMTANVETKKYENGAWQSVDSRVEGGKVIISATEFTSYGLFLNVGVSVSKGSESISFAQNKWDNLYGSNDMQVGNVSYTYKVGTEITSRGTTVLEALLIEHLARLYGATVKNVEGSYPVNVTLPIGTILQMVGTQERNNVTVRVSGTSVSGTNYGSVTVSAVTANRNHTGSSN